MKMHQIALKCIKMHYNALELPKIVKSADSPSNQVHITIHFLANMSYLCIIIIRKIIFVNQKKYHHK